MNKIFKNENGFIELIISIFIIGVLGSIFVTALFDFAKKEEIAKKTGSFIREFKQEVSTTEGVPMSNLDKRFSEIGQRIYIECLEGKQIIKINEKIYHIGNIDSWGDVKSIDCEE